MHSSLQHTGAAASGRTQEVDGPHSGTAIENNRDSAVTPKELAELCQYFQLEELTPSQVQAVEKATRSQAASRICYGRKHEAQARGEYERLMRLEHEGFSCMESGFWLNPKWPYMGASPDGIVTCDCHGTGICEIKCPHCKKDDLRLCAETRGDSALSKMGMKLYWIGAMVTTTKSRHSFTLWIMSIVTLWCGTVMTFLWRGFYLTWAFGMM
ncbi:hypothetical protein QQF64_031493 [Cirrhinus molitorella]|uniref:YqaJ viral recombinase domain-containing protein n=1 Tax=Cirrhinus molitorella TaxID=172907 RepID=A0ABR3MX68_9TELE